jgi:hypothetical protein
VSTNPTVREFGKRYYKEQVMRNWKDPKVIRRDVGSEIYPTLGEMALRDVNALDVHADDVRMGVTGILPYYQMKFGESIANALSKLAWFRRLIWSFMPFTLLPFVFPRTTISFFWRRKYLLLLFVLAVITDLWGTDHGGGRCREAHGACVPSSLLVHCDAAAARTFGCEVGAHGNARRRVSFEPPSSAGDLPIAE